MLFDKKYGDYAHEHKLRGRAFLGRICYDSTESKMLSEIDL